MKNQKKFALIVLLSAGTAFASPGRGYDEGPANNRWYANQPTPYQQGTELARAGKFSEAMPFFEEAVRANPNDADALNMLAYTQRNLGKLDESIVNYNRALQLRPDFPQAHEYLGEAYLQGVLRELKILEGYGDRGKKDYDTLIQSLRQAIPKSN